MPAALKTQPQDETLVRARHKQIFDAACRVLARKSFHEASVKELALEAGLAAGSIYVYLQSKDDILLLIAEVMVGELTEMLPTIRERAGGDPRLELIGVVRRILDVIDRYREAFAVLHQEARYLQHRPHYRAAMKKIGGQYFSAVAAVIDRGKTLGLFDFVDTPSAVESIHMLCAGWAMGAHNLRDTGKETYWREISALIESRFTSDGKKTAAAGR